MMWDEPWYALSSEAKPFLLAMAERIARKLGRENCVFEPFDLGAQLGVCYTNPKNGKRWAARLRYDAGAEVIDSVVRSLEEATMERLAG